MGGLAGGAPVGGSAIDAGTAAVFGRFGAATAGTRYLDHLSVRDVSGGGWTATHLHHDG